MSKSILAWHFVEGKLRNGDPVPPDGQTLFYKGNLVLCQSGLHASKRIINALNYSPGDTICRVRCGGEMVHSHDKLVCRERTILWRINGEHVLRKFACLQALSVAHLWDMPDIVRRYLETLDEELRTAAGDAAGAAARAAVWAAAGATARAAAGAATRDAAWAAAWAVARDAAWAAARDATRAAARDAAWAAARDAAWAAAWDAARDAAWAAAGAAAWDAACDAARDAASKELQKLVISEHNITKRK